MSETELKTLSRRQALGLFGAAGAALSVGACDGETPTGPTASTTTTVTTTDTTTTPPSSGTCAVTPSETSGPFPSIALPTRSDVREDRTGLLLTLAISVVNTNTSCAPVTNASVEIWHCDARGDYSEYGTQTSATWLRGLQPVDSSGAATFTTVYPGWYQGRATHIHVEVFVDNRTVKATQIAFPEDINNAVYATGVYAARGANPQKNANDGIFSDSISSELATMSGNTTSGYTASFTVGVAI